MTGAAGNAVFNTAQALRTVALSLVYGDASVSSCVDGGRINSLAPADCVRILPRMGQTRAVRRTRHSTSRKTRILTRKLDAPSGGGVPGDRHLGMSARPPRA